MGQADDFLSSFYAYYPKAKAGQLTLDELNRCMKEHQERLNNRPIDDFDGISPNQMLVLQREGLSDQCVLGFKPSIDQFIDHVPLFKLSELLLQTISQAGQLKLTVKGNLPVKVCEQLFNLQLIKWPYMEYVKRIREEEIPYLWPLKQYLLDEGIAKKRGNALSLTKYGEKLLFGPATARFKTLFFFFTGRFNWNNLYDIDDNGWCGQFGWAYSLLLLSRYGSAPLENEFYGTKHMIAFQKQLYEKRKEPQYKESITLYHRAYAIRFMENFADWFGLVNIERRKNLQISFFDQFIITKSTLFDNLLQEVKSEK